jgi:hypothetical protein
MDNAVREGEKAGLTFEGVNVDTNADADAKRAAKRTATRVFIVLAIIMVESSGTCMYVVCHTATAIGAFVSALCSEKPPRVDQIGPVLPVLPHSRHRKAKRSIIFLPITFLAIHIAPSFLGGRTL